MHSYTIDGKVFDFTYTPRPTEGMYTFKLVGNDKYMNLGTVHHADRKWTAVTVKSRSDGFGGIVDGFASRTDAANYLISHFMHKMRIKAL